MPKATTRKRRTAEEAREAILDAAEKRLAVVGPMGIRLHDVAKDVGVSHPTVLHHFGDRDALVEAVVNRALDSLHVSLLAALAASTPGPNQVSELLERVDVALTQSGHARAFLWLALGGYPMTADDLRIRSFADVVHEVRREKRRASKRDVPTYEDTYFSVLLPALALMTLSVLDQKKHAKRELDAAHFRRWLAKLIHHHLETAT